MILPWLILIPFIGGFLCWLGERFGATLPRWIALLTMSLLLGIGLWLWATGDYTLALVLRNEKDQRMPGRQEGRKGKLFPVSIPVRIAPQAPAGP